MAKYRRYRKYSRRGRGRWASNIQEISTTVANAAQGANYATTTLAFNPIQTSTATSQVYTVKNFETSFTFEIPSNSTVTTSNIEDITAYIMFVPQGMQVDADYNNIHPEYIMNYKFIGSPTLDSSTSGQQYQPFKIRTRMARKLNTGDSVILFIKYNNQGSTVSGPIFEVHGLNRWWTKAN